MSKKVTKSLNLYFVRPFVVITYINLPFWLYNYTNKFAFFALREIKHILCTSMQHILIWLT
jgi:hypothetical protein